MKTVLVVSPGSLTKPDKAKLGEDDIVVVEAENPESVRWMKPGEVFDPDDMLRAAIYTISKATDTTKARFIDQLAIISKAAKGAKNE